MGGPDERRSSQGSMWSVAVVQKSDGDLDEHHGILRCGLNLCIPDKALFVNTEVRPQTPF